MSGHITDIVQHIGMMNILVRKNNNETGLTFRQYQNVPTQEGNVILRRTVNPGGKKTK